MEESKPSSLEDIYPSWKVLHDPSVLPEALHKAFFWIISTFLAFSPENCRISGEEGGVGAAELGCPALLEWNSKPRASLAAQHVNSQPANSPLRGGGTHGFVELSPQAVGAILQLPLLLLPLLPHLGELLVDPDHERKARPGICNRLTPKATSSALSPQFLRAAGQAQP